MATARVVAPPMRAFSAALSPLIRLLNGSANGILRLVGVEPQEELSIGRSPEELAALVRRSAEVGTLERQTATLLTRTLGFASRTAADVMTAARAHARPAHATRPRPTSSRWPAAPATAGSRSPGRTWTTSSAVVHLQSAVAVPRDRRDEVPVGRADVRGAAGPRDRAARPAAGGAARARPAAGGRRRRVRRHRRRRHAGGPRRGARGRGRRRARPQPARRRPPPRTGRGSCRG